MGHFAIRDKRHRILYAPSGIYPRLRQSCEPSAVAVWLLRLLLFKLILSSGIVKLLSGDDSGLTSQPSTIISGPPSRIHCPGMLTIAMMLLGKQALCSIISSNFCTLADYF